nr:proline-rich protein 36-like [Aegilops tauschii subsp. strangulata]
MALVTQSWDGATDADLEQLIGRGAPDQPHARLSLPPARPVSLFPPATARARASLIPLCRSRASPVPRASLAARPPLALAAHTHGGRAWLRPPLAPPRLPLRSGRATTSSRRRSRAARRPLCSTAAVCLDLAHLSPTSPRPPQATSLSLLRRPTVAAGAQSGNGSLRRTPDAAPPRIPSPEPPRWSCPAALFVVDLVPILLLDTYCLSPYAHTVRPRPLILPLSPYAHPASRLGSAAPGLVGAISQSSLSAALRDATCRPARARPHCPMAAPRPTPRAPLPSPLSRPVPLFQPSTARAGASLIPLRRSRASPVPQASLAARPPLALAAHTHGGRAWLRPPLAPPWLPLRSGRTTTSSRRSRHPARWPLCSTATVRLDLARLSPTSPRLPQVNSLSLFWRPTVAAGAPSGAALSATPAARIRDAPAPVNPSAARPLRPLANDMRGPRP